MKTSKKTQDIKQIIPQNKLKLGHFQLSTRSIILIYVALFLLFFSFVIFCVSSCTKDIAISYIKELKKESTQQVVVQNNKKEK